MPVTAVSGSWLQVQCELLAVDAARDAHICKAARLTVAERVGVEGTSARAALRRFNPASPVRMTECLIKLLANIGSKNRPVGGRQKSVSRIVERVSKLLAYRWLRQDRSEGSLYIGLGDLSQQRRCKTRGWVGQQRCECVLRVDRPA